MAGRGPAGDGKGHRTKAEKEVTVIGADERPDDVPALVGDYSETTQAWWQTWAHAPHATLFTSTDWQRLIMLAPLVDGYMRAPSKDLLSEIRLNESLLGATVVDRMRGKVEVKHEVLAAPAGVDDELERRRKEREANLA